MLLKPSPNRPSLAGSRVNAVEMRVASSMHCLSTVVPPTSTVSKPTVPDAPLPSPYEMDQVAFSSSVYVGLKEGLYAEWLPIREAGSKLENIHKSDDPVSKLRLNDWPPIVTGDRYSISLASGVASTSPSSLPSVEVEFG